MSSPRHSGSRRKPSPNPPVKPPVRLRWVLGLTLLAAACAVCFWYWRQYVRPGPVHNRQAQQDMAAGKVSDAEQEWQQGIQEDPGYAPNYIHLGDLYRQAKRFPEAVTAYTEAVRLAPNDGTLFLHLYHVAVAVGNVQLAGASAKRAAALRPDDPEALGLYGLWEVQQKNEAAALPFLRRAHQLRPDDREYLLELVRIEIENTDFAQAQSDLAPYLQAHPTDFWACHLMGVIFELKSHDDADWKTALAYEQRAVAGLPNDPRLYIALGDLNLDLNRPADALQAFQTGQKLLPNSEAMWHGLVRSYSLLGEKKQAAASALALQRLAARHQQISFLREQMVLNPADVVSGLALARLQEEESDDEAAHAVLTELLRHAPRDPRAHRALADFYLRYHRPGLAKQALRMDFVP